MTNPAKPTIPPLSHANSREHLRLLAIAIRNIFNGKLHSTGSVTLTASQATTVVTDFRVGATSYINFCPLTANAAAELAAGTMYVGASDRAPLTNQFTINHANNAQVDRDFYYIIIG